MLAVRCLIKDKWPVVALSTVVLVVGVALVYVPGLIAWGIYEIGGEQGFNFATGLLGLIIISGAVAFVGLGSILAIRNRGEAIGHKAGYAEARKVIVPMVEQRSTEATLDLVNTGILPQNELLAGRYEVVSCATEPNQGTTLVILKGQFGGRRAERIVRLQSRHVADLTVGGIYDFTTKPAPLFERVG